ncbi:hypothetical protein [Bradyrhizobium sp. 191]|uniref:hypothetical protein n=1 Tax=Bradyrhizobium sp. 191 TaxID=2782659 RepID=UPI001FFFA83A|nr:hypothetical protein [Bradyrhizobium sp. 191]UPJ64283.1 hypothetical protein IVB23_30585 [Bradyrhizobium sp. 191]
MANDKNYLTLIWTMFAFVWDSLLKLPSIFVALAIALQILRRFLKANSNASLRIGAYEKLLRKLSASFGATGGPTFTIAKYNISGGAIGAVGDQAQANNFRQQN